ncbi:MAG: hypothetical protein ABIX01_21605 [Chitinophagaceae bacterium]
MNNTEANLDLTDAPRDRERLKADIAIIDLPSVKDIPGQEHVRPMPAGEMADTTISSADEEGVGVLDDWDEGEADDDDDTEGDDGIDIDEEVVIGEDEMTIGDEDLQMDDADSQDDDDEDEDGDSDVTAMEKEMLANAASFTPTEEELSLSAASPDATDEEGVLLNEVDVVGEKFGGSLDVPGSELDDADEKIGDEDEENNLYSPAQQ